MDKAPDAFRTISEVADDLDVPQHVLRFWETRFAQIRPMKRGGGRRYYRPDDVDLLRGIRHLLYGEGYTIRGVQRILKDNGIKFVQSVWKSGAPQPEVPQADEALDFDETVQPAPEAAAEDIEAAGELHLPGAPALLRDPPARHIVRANLPSSGPAGEAVARTVAAVAERATAPEPAALSREDLRKLQATLYELGECRRLLDAALRDE